MPKTRAAGVTEFATQAKCARRDEIASGPSFLHSSELLPLSRSPGLGTEAAERAARWWRMAVAVQPVEVRYGGGQRNLDTMVPVY